MTFIVQIVAELYSGYRAPTLPTILCPRRTMTKLSGWRPVIWGCRECTTRAPATNINSRPHEPRGARICYLHAACGNCSGTCQA